MIENKTKPFFIVFLDFDGVLHPHFPLSNLPDEENAYFSYKGNFEKCIRSLLVDYRLGIVISSSWADDRDLDTLKTFFSKDIAKHIIGKVRRLFKYTHDREDECLMYLKEHKLDVPWLALDDSYMLFKSHEKLIICPDHFKDKQANELRYKVAALFPKAS